MDNSDSVCTSCKQVMCRVDCRHNDAISYTTPDSSLRYLLFHRILGQDRRARLSLKSPSELMVQFTTAYGNSLRVSAKLTNVGMPYSY